VPVQWWRSVGSTHTAFATECFLDEVARATKRDPFQLRRALLASTRATSGARARRAAGGLGQAARRRQRCGPLARHRVHESFNTFVAQVAEISRKKDGSLRLERVVCAVDCGVAVNPNIIAMQMESGIGYGLSAALTGAITLKDAASSSPTSTTTGAAHQPMPRSSPHRCFKEKPSGVGEPATPVIAPALANAILALGGKPVRALPLSAQGITFS